MTPAGSARREAIACYRAKDAPAGRYPAGLTRAGTRPALRSTGPARRPVGQQGSESTARESTLTSTLTSTFPTDGRRGTQTPGAPRRPSVGNVDVSVDVS